MLYCSVSLRSAPLFCVLFNSAPCPAEVTPAAEAPAAATTDGTWISVIPPEDLPKGVRKEVIVDGKSILLFWYRNSIYAIASRSPAEGAYSEGFIKAKFTQEYGIICPSTGSIFSLKDGSIVEWYPTNPVLRSITPQSGGLTVSATPLILTLSVVPHLTCACHKQCRHACTVNWEQTVVACLLRHQCLCADLPCEAHPGRYSSESG